MPKGWIAVDFDGVTAVFVGNGVTLGPPIMTMVAKIRAWRANGQEVRIFTARASYKDKKKRAAAVKVIEDFCLEHVGERLPVTNEKDFDCIRIYDDKAREMIPNTGLTYREFHAKHRRVSHTTQARSRRFG